ncbi:ankyrin repeat domain-containing protein [Tsuneonella mangrovi]|uniref:ankyrin repeat domain-containing protein n=1 Tax=Tsuneonella mangrovi TaxID=1982042 RepID=UPI000BA1D5C1|nr:ankyrin repeat domain-containing protein [Tsuneonella mangrovi]
MPRAILRYLGLMLAAAMMLGANPAAAQRFSDGYLFLKAVKDRDGNKATALIQDPGSTVINARDQMTGDSALFIVVERKDGLWLRFLLDRGADPNLANYAGATPLTRAVNLGWVDGVERLAKAGAQVNVNNDTGETPLITAVHQRDVPMIRVLLQYGADADRTDNSGRSARDYAKLMGASAGIEDVIETAEAARGGAASNTYGPGQ